MKPNKMKILNFIQSINLQKFAKIGDITCFDNMACLKIVDTHIDPGSIHHEIANKFNLNSVDSQDEFGNILYMVNLPQFGSFGIKRMKSIHFDGFIFDFVIYNKKYFKQFNTLSYQ